MNFDELIEVLEGLPGRMVEASVEIPDDGNSTLQIASFSGIVSVVYRGEASNLPERWYILWEDDGIPKPNHGTVVVRRDGYEQASVKGSQTTLEEVMEENDPSGTEWTIEIRQSGTLIRLAAYF